jgi:transcription initiation factor IIF auxiliary subunit
MAIHFYLTFGQSSYEMAFYAKMQLNNYKLRQSLAGSHAVELDSFLYCCC